MAAVADTFKTEFAWVRKTAVVTKTVIVTAPAVTTSAVVADASATAPVGGGDTGDGSTAPASTNRNNLLGGLALMILGGATLLRRRVASFRK